MRTSGCTGKGRQAVAPDSNWIVTVMFGGSGGTDEWTPEAGGLPVMAVDIFPPFVGDPSG